MSLLTFGFRSYVVVDAADALVAASLTMLPLLPRVLFLVVGWRSIVGRAVDVKRPAMQAGLLGRPFAVRFVRRSSATVVATIVGLVFLGGARESGIDEQVCPRCTIGRRCG